MSIFKNNDKYEILTENGFKKFVGITNKSKQNVYELVTSSGKRIQATLDHNFYIGIQKNKTQFKDIKIGDEINTIDGIEKVSNIISKDKKNVFDIIEVEGNNTFLCNDIITKNCDELAFVKPHMQTEFWDSIYPTLSCLAGETLVLTNKGYRRIDNFFHDDISEKIIPFKEDLELYTHKGMCKPSHKYISPPSRLLNIETFNGNNLKLTKNHPLMVWNNYGQDLIRSIYLKKKSILRVDFGMNCYGEVKLTDDEAYQCGYNQPLEVFTLGNCILSFNEQSMKSFLSGFIDNRMQLNEKKLVINLNNPEIANELQLLFANVGIFANVKKLFFKKKYILTIDCATNNVKNILYNIKEKTLLNNFFDVNILSDLNSVFNEMYFKVFNRIVKECDSNNQYFKENGIKIPKKSGRTLKSDIKIFKNFLIEKNIDVSGFMINVLDELVYETSCWIKIRKIKRGKKEKTYDLTVPDSGTFLQNGIMGSNTGGSCIISSTPNGSVNLFAQLWRKWKSGRGAFKGMYVPWDAPPGRDEAFKKEKIETLGKEKWEQEYECKFLSSDGTLVDTAIIEDHEKKILDVVPAFKMEDQVFWKKIHPEKTYIIGCDPATGSKKDFSVIEVFEFPSMEQVMEFRDNTISPEFLYTYLKKVVNFFHRQGGEAYWSFENNTVGMSMVALYETDENPPDAALISEPAKNKVGFHTSNASKVKACLRFKEMFEAGKITINSKDFITEMQSYVRKSNSYEAQVGATDDCIAAFLIVLRVLEEMATYDADAYYKLYGLEDEKEWVPDESNIDQNPLPFIL